MYKWIAICLGAVLVLQLTMGIGFNPKSESNITASAENADDENRIAVELSNLSGASKDDILQWRSTGKSWNDIITLLSKRDDGLNGTTKAERSQLLADSGLDKEFIKNLTDAGYAQAEITDAKLLAERILFQLQEIVRSVDNRPEQPVVDLKDENQDSKDLSVYIKISDQFDLKTAVYAMVVLKKEFGSIDNVMNEYLFALQIGLNFEGYFTDKEKYYQDKEDKNIGINPDSIITIDKIENRMLETIQQGNALSQNDFTTSEDRAALPDESQVNNPLPDVPNPNAKDVNPENPTDAVMKEIQSIDPNRQ
ncbi:hypothetical protein [Cohnella cholangitidis]|uniref:Uncharacterized protein n=1 Tax=Cohnella cholangitidis TaxID=2598458 RepID=A0A7G5BZQ0_9BACL|nr:hypothetical protein [Cohnella cholangitidis]QMV42434.1 hypothetical protein FPL14_15435 [Cohnella cholangitidis]